MPLSPDAVLQDRDDRVALRFERVLRHPPERVWTALTEPGELFSWHPTPFEVHPADAGATGTVTFLPGGDVEMPEGELLDYDPPRVIAYDWGEDQLRWELSAHDDGCLLVLTHTFGDRFKAARDAAGWHLCLEALSSLLDGSLEPGKRGIAEVPPGWQALNSEYEQRFGIPPEKATPPPS